MKNKTAWIIILLAIIGLIVWQTQIVTNGPDILESDTDSFKNFKSSWFDCGDVSEYKDSDWYKEFLRGVEDINSLSFNEDDSSGGINIENITEACHSDNGFALVLVPGVYGGEGFNLIRYDISTYRVELAKREDTDGGKDTSWFKNTHKNYLEKAPEKARDVYKWFIAPDSFVTQEGNVIKMSGSLHDRGCSGEVEFEYSLENNYTRILNRCLSCEGNPEKNCTQY